jgi:Trk K+ transport system NAD-binding subunit
VLPAHIGAERIAEMILYPENTDQAASLADLGDFQRSLGVFGLRLEAVVVTEGGALDGLTVAEIERRARARSLVLRISHKGGETIDRPRGDSRVRAGDGLNILAREDDLAEWGLA